MALPADIDFTLNPAASPARMDRAMAHLDGRLGALEVPAKSFDAVLLSLQSIGLQRITDALTPVYASLVAIGQLGAVFTASSSTPATFGLGTKTFVVAADQRSTFAAAAYISAVAASDATQSLSGRVQSYDRATGTLTVLCDAFTGTQDASNAAWTLTASVDFSQIKNYVDAAVAAAKAQVIGSADSAGDTLGELEAMLAAAQAAISTLNTAVPQAQANATAAASAQALALAIALG